MSFSLPGISYIKEKISFSVSFAKCARELLLERLADAHTNVDDSHPLNHPIVTKSILQHGRLETALLSAAVENVACLVSLSKHGLLEISDRVLPIVKFRTRATLQFIRNYLAEKSTRNAKGNLAMHFALSRTVTLRTAHSELRKLFGNDYIYSTLRCVWSMVERVLILLADSLSEANDTIAYESQRSTAIWMVYTLARGLFAINLCSTSVILAFLSVYTCEPSEKTCSMTAGVLPLSSSGEDLPAVVSIIVSMASVSDVLECDTTIPVASPSCQTISVDGDRSISAIFSCGTVLLAPVDSAEKFAEKPTTETNILDSTVKDDGPEHSRQKENNTFDVDADNNIKERKPGDVVPKLFDVKSGSNSCTNESIKITISSSLGEDEFPLSPSVQETSGIFESPENTAQDGRSTAYDNTANELSHRIISKSIPPEGKSRMSEGVLEMDHDTTHNLPSAEEISPSCSNNDTYDNANKENRFCPKNRDRSRSLSSEIRAWTQLNASLSEKENNPDLTIRQQNNGKGKERIDESSPIDILEDLIHGRFDQALAPNSKGQIGAKASFSVHLDTDAVPARLLASSQSPPPVPATETQDQLDLFSIDINYHEEKYKIKTRMPPANSKLYDKNPILAPEVSINKNDELQITSRIPLESIHTRNYSFQTSSSTSFTPHAPIFVPSHMRTNGSENRAQPLPLHWRPALGGPISIVAPTSRRRSRLGALATGDKRKDNLTRRTLS